ncbi:quinone-dependent dihydroorotate dehydrogenase [Brevibacterium litoralis]|uniref:quinone-dependent dihydroorotate dehydrogenase n=1 Tax=Brevibacterium litoralis TaxID=3138935 RepID=UPI0032ED0EC8
MVYSLVFRTLFVPMDAERAHSLSFGALRALDRVPVARDLARRVLAPRQRPEPVRALGLTFPNRVGLAAGFDKAGRGVRALSMLGFGHVEIGTVTGQGQPGNPQPRLFRLLDHEAILNRMGFNNPGAEVVAENLRRARAELDAMDPAVRPVLGVNIGKTKVVPAAEAIEDYRASARTLAPLADYLVINVSSPNTPGLRDLQSTEALGPIVQAVRAAADEAVAESVAAGGPAPASDLGHVPLLVKIAPDLADSDVLAVADMAVGLGVDGLITTNTTIDRSVLDGADREFAEAEAGGISGAPLTARAREVTRMVKEHVGDALTVVSVGGIGDAAEANVRLADGADLVQLYSALVYRGPALVGRVLDGIRPTTGPVVRGPVSSGTGAA